MLSGSLIYVTFSYHIPKAKQRNLRGTMATLSTCSHWESTVNSSGETRWRTGSGGLRAVAFCFLFCRCLESDAKMHSKINVNKMCFAASKEQRCPKFSILTSLKNFFIPAHRTCCEKEITEWHKTTSLSSGRLYLESSLNVSAPLGLWERFSFSLCNIMNKNVRQLVLIFFVNTILLNGAVPAAGESGHKPCCPYALGWQ